MIPDLQSSLLCDDVRQERNGKFMLIGLFDALIVPAFPAVFHRLCMVNRWCCGSGTFTQQTRLIRPDSDDVLTSGRPVKVDLSDASATATCIEVFGNVKFEKEGTYWVEVLLDKQLKLRYPLRAIVGKPRPPPGANPPPAPN